jgi:penicillin V acylase-like amidase (Ntn superfamily)
MPTSCRYRWQRRSADPVQRLGVRSTNDGQLITSDDQAAVDWQTWTAKHGFIGVGTPGEVPKSGVPIPPSSLLIFDGMNDAGLVSNANAYPDNGETPDSGGPGAVLEAAHFGAW